MSRQKTMDSGGWFSLPLLLILAGAMAFAPLAVAQDLSDFDYSVVPAGTGAYKAQQQAQTYDPDAVPDWVNRLRGQVLIEETLEGRSGRTAKIARMHQKMMDHAAAERKGAVRDVSGPRTYSDMLHQMGLMGNDIILEAADQAVSDSMNTGGSCPANAPKRVFDIKAIEVEITLNQWHMFYPGYMFVLAEELERVRAEEERNEEAREAGKDANDPGAVTNGLQGDAIQPLVIRGVPGECAVFGVENTLDSPISFRIHGSNMVVKKTGAPAILTNPDAMIDAEDSQVFEWYLRPDEQEGGHQLQSMGQREQSSLGLVGVFVVEPPGSTFLSPFMDQEGQELTSGWEAIIAHPTKPDFREFVLIYHEVGDESFRPLDIEDEMLPQRDPLSDAYRPASRALNFRSEPFGIAMLQKQKDLFHFEDESAAYSSYTFGDVPTTVFRSYLGDPAKVRLAHGGSEVFHSHHPHGGTIRWLRQPTAGDRRMFADGVDGPIKYPVIRTASDRVDVQVIGPTEVFDLDVECGSGLCQQLAGDFLYHCHVAHHYVAGMWGYWRVYNTIQSGNYPHVSTDIMRPLAELPDRKGLMPTPVTSDQLVGKTMNWFGKKYEVTKDKTDWSANPPKVSITDWVTAMVPTQGQRGGTDDEFKQVMAHDPTVLPWKWDGLKAMNEPMTTFEWPKYKPAQGNRHDWTPMPGKRPAFLFEPKTGKVAWPHLHPHLGMRPLFAHNHNPAPWLEPFHVGTDTKPLTYGDEPGADAPAGQYNTKPASPGEHGPWSLCPQNSGRTQFTINFVKLPIEVSPARGKSPAIIDESGLLFILAEEEEKVRKTPSMQVPLVMRANVYDCIDLMLKSKWPDDMAQNLLGSKVNMHHHFHQFDNQSSDGVISGFSYEQAMRPYDMLENNHEGHGLPLPQNDILVKAAKKGDTVLHIKGLPHAGFHPNIELGVGMDQVETFEIVRIKSVDGNTLTLQQGLQHDHATQEIVSVEFVRERFYVDVDYGTVYCHDHAFGVTTWPHGATCQIVAEPPNSTYHDPITGEMVRSGPVADIRTREIIGVSNTGHTITGSFRELVIDFFDTVPSTAQIIYDGNPEGFDPKKQIADLQTITFEMPVDIPDSPFPRLNGGQHTTGGAFNMKAEPLTKRLRNDSDPSKLFSSTVHGDPATPLVRAYLGDPIMFREIVQGMNETHTWILTGHYFRPEQHMVDAQPDNTLHIGIAERYNLLVPAAGGPQQMAGDYLHYNGWLSKLGEGSWGLVRVFDEVQSDLQVLPGREEIAKSAKSVCPADAPVKTFDVAAIDYAMNLNPSAPETITVDFDRKLTMTNPNGKAYVLKSEVQKVSSGSLRPHPLTLRINSGDCLKVNLTNNMKEESAGMHIDMLAYDPHDAAIAVGNNKGGAPIPPGGSKTYTYYAHPELGVMNSGLIRDWGNVLINPRDGLYGAVAIGPRGSKYRDPVTGADVSMANTWQADVIVDRSISENARYDDYRDAVLMFQEEDQIMGTAFMPYLQQTAGLVMVNYRLDPYAHRQELGCDSMNMFFCADAGKDPATPTIAAHAGDKVVIHVFGASMEQNQIFTIEGHEWPLEPFRAGADLLSSHQIGSGEKMEVHITAGGPASMTGDFMYMDTRMAGMEAGLWGLLRVLPEGDKSLMALNPTDRNTMFAQDDVTTKPVSLEK